jgi:hypothetical protein
MYNLHVFVVERAEIRVPVPTLYEEGLYRLYERVHMACDQISYVLN